ncbi:hypothetical protein DL764_006472 [Monosporascus ibericus]|uniref:Xylanolytic transcriptional activator regulatory domain-containing protein n=1 Tax=Monosporascus ibericus TaxID=155417 RepID=A0A4Q4T7T3_9PEZI|nr:hypothetical protein DL764_006472 [Monosporascus ibericus]
MDGRDDNARLPMLNPMAQSDPSPAPEMPAAQVPSFQEHDMSEFLRGVMTPTVPSFPAQAWMEIDSIGPRGLLDFTSEGVDFNDADFGFLDQLCSDPFSSEQQLQPKLPQIPESSCSKGPRKHVALGAEAFKRSTLGIWLPAHQDRADTELENLSALSAEAGSPDTRINLERRCLRETLNISARDEFLAMILRTCKPERVSFVVKTFPPPELLDDLIDCFFSNHRQQTDCYIHIPTFSPNQQQPELLGGVVAFGATMTYVRSLHKLGFAMQEAVRMMVRGRCEEENSRTRELWLLQAFLCELQIGMWSGIKRKMEIAESHTQTVHTMLRRAGRLRRLKRLSSEPVLQDTGNVLHRKWLEWVEQESIKRLVFHAFIYDAQVSMAMLTNPIISYSELAIPLPESRDLWMAEDAEKWKTLYLNRPRSQNRQLSLLDFLQQPTELPESYDVHFCSLIILYGIWGMIWQHVQLASTLKRSGQINAFTAFRHQELLQTLHNFRINIYGCQYPPCPETSLVLELLHMYLHIDIGEMQLFAGKEDIEDARRVLPSLQQWVDSPDSRHAVWHAGQALRAAKAFPPKQLCRFYAIAVYHAGLTLWVYGIISQSKGARDKASFPNTAAHAVPLDGPESPTTQRFITLGKGIPSIGFRYGADPTAGLVPFSDEEAVMNVVVETLKNNFPASLDTDEAPPLVQNLIQLLQDLGKAARGIGT